MIEDYLYKAKSPRDIFRIANKTCNVVTYDKIKNLKNINDLFKVKNSVTRNFDMNLPHVNNCCIILYMTKPNFGHYCMVNKNRHGINFLDSYGEMPDDQLNYIKDEFKIVSNQEKNYLTKLLAESDLPVRYNDLDMQIMDGKIATCGLYCALYLKYNNLSIEQFCDILRKNSLKKDIDIDRIVAAISYYLDNEEEFSD